ncbi:MAG: nitrogenase cofactor biosynthesis protein NifB [Euryarchaeota archaeon]|nr:nitrogenase cofactor biosynthesis protein NifB [Euryarchaeota archaeon]
MSENEYPTANVMGKDIPWDPEQLRRIQEHPCFSAKACHRFGRMHLAVAPKCNIQCNYCIREFDCVNECRPGVTSHVLTPEEALARVDEVMEKVHYIKVVAVAGPGEPLFNKQTFETFKLVGEKYPHLLLCISTNGLLLPEKIDLLDELGVGNVTVTLNAVDPEIGKEIYEYVTYEGKKYTGYEAAQIMLDHQLRGIEEAVKRKMIVKVNTVLIPTINDDHVMEVARTIKKLGAYIQNVMPLIPQYQFSHITPPSPAEKRAVQDELSKVMRQMRHCRQCRSDAIGILGKDIQDQFDKVTKDKVEEQAAR